jgi:hypothetical protein
MAVASYRRKTTSLEGPIFDVGGTLKLIIGGETATLWWPALAEGQDLSALGQDE